MCKFLTTIALSVFSLLFSPAEAAFPASCCFFESSPYVYSYPLVHQLNAKFLTPPSGFFFDKRESFFELEDGSRWIFDSNNDAYLWHEFDEVLITQNTSLFGSREYKLINQTTGASVQADLHLGPLQGGPHTRYITSIDHYNGLIVLTDNTHWEINSCDASEADFRNWALYDALILGINTKGSLTHEALLINVNMGKPIRARQY